MSGVLDLICFNTIVGSRLPYCKYIDELAILMHVEWEFKRWDFWFCVSVNIEAYYKGIIISRCSKYYMQIVVLKARQAVNQTLDIMHDSINPNLNWLLVYFSVFEMKETR